VNAKRPGALTRRAGREVQTMPRLVYLLGVALLLVGGALALTHELLGPWPGVNERNVRRIRPGMTRGEVECLLGPPAGMPREWLANRGEIGVPPMTATQGTYDKWRGPRAAARVYFDLSGRVVKVSLRWPPGAVTLDRPRLPAGR
jgi:hypothetical protein